MKTMAMDLNPGSRVRMALDRHQTLSTRDAHGMALECLSGSLWITFEGSNDDYFLQPGERLPLRTRGRIVIQAMEGGEFVFYPPAVESTIKPTRDRSVKLAESSAQCWRSFISGLSAQRFNLDAPL